MIRLFLSLILISFYTLSVKAESFPLEKYKEQIDNLETVKNLLEIYADKYGGIYPAEISVTLINELDSRNHEKISSMKNKYKNKSLKENIIFTDYYIYQQPIFRLNMNGTVPQFAGMVVYQPLEFKANEYNPDRIEYKRYMLFIADEEGSLIKNNSEVFSYEKKDYHPNLGKPINRNVTDDIITFRRVINNYLVASGVGFYPCSIEQLYKDATNKEYWRNIKNPFSGKSEKQDSIVDFTTYNQTKNKKSFAGYIIYAPEDCNTNDEGKSFCRKFKVFGVDKEGNLLN